jgi:hypothetical protein
MWGALFDEKTGLSFVIAAGSRQRSHSRVRVPRASLLFSRGTYRIENAVASNSIVALVSVSRDTCLSSRYLAVGDFFWLYYACF